MKEINMSEKDGVFVENSNPVLYIFKDKIMSDKFINDNIVSINLQKEFYLKLGGITYE